MQHMPKACIKPSFKAPNQGKSMDYNQNSIMALPFFKYYPNSVSDIFVDAIFFNI